MEGVPGPQHPPPEWEWRRVAIRVLLVVLACGALWGVMKGGVLWQRIVVVEPRTPPPDRTEPPPAPVTTSAPTTSQPFNGTSLCRSRAAGEEGFAVVSYLMYEHDYVEYFVAYHARLGFHRFYFLVDNIDGNAQPPYEIDPRLAGCVDVTVVVAADTAGMPSHPLPRSLELNRLVNAKLLPRIKEDWILVNGIDSFLWLDGLTLPEYFAKYPEIKSRDVSEIFFPWIIATNVFDSAVRDPMHRSDCLTMEVPHNHASPMARRDRVTGLADHSHSFEMRAPTMTMFSCGVVTAGMASSTFVLDIFKLLLKTYDPDKGALIHLVLRNYDEVALKGFFSWTKQAARAANRDAVRALVAGGALSPEQRKALGSRLVFLEKVAAASSKFRIPRAKAPPPTTHPVKSAATQRLVDAMLRECGLSRDEYQRWKNRTREAYVKKFAGSIAACEV